MKLRVCNSCGVHYIIGGSGCPHCGIQLPRGSGRRAAMLLLLGLGTAGCWEKNTSDDDDDFNQEDSAGEPAAEPGEEPAYGVVDTGPDPEPGVEPEPDIAALYGDPEPSEEPDIDADGDGWGEWNDCNDEDPNTFPGAAENDSTSECMTDADGDGYGAGEPAAGVEAGSDCDDSDSSVYPGATEIPGDGIDQDCDGQDTEAPPE